MPEPLAICIEDLGARDPGGRYLRCVAIPGRRPGLRVDRAGQVLWKSDEAVACELWVSADDRLILYRPSGAAPVACRRDGRSLEVPEERAVVLLDQDCIDVGSKRMRVHIHGTATAIRPPALLPASRGSGFGRTAAAAVALGAALAATDCKKDGPPVNIEIRTEPPKIEVPEEDAAPTNDSFVQDASLPGELPDADAADAGTSSALPDAAPIEVRVAPPQVPAPMEPDAVEPADVPAQEAPAPADATATEDAATKDARRRRPPIEVRDMPPFEK